MKLLTCFLLNLLAFNLLAFSYSKASDVKIEKLRTEYAETPIGIDVRLPRFSWQMVASKRGCFQTAYQLVVSDETGLKVWDSGKIPSKLSLNIKYAGSALKPSTRYHWNLTVWDQEKEKHIASSWFETGLMNPDPQLSAWNGAKWIGGTDQDLVLYSPYLPVFKINITLQLDQATNSHKAGFVYGANDQRLMDKNKNINQLESKKDSSYLMVELDISPINVHKPAQLNIYRKGYSPHDKTNSPFKTFLIPDSILNAQNRFDAFTISWTSVLGDSKFYIGRNNKLNYLGDVNLNPLGRGGDYIAFPVLADLGLYVPEKQTASFSNLQVRNYRSPSNLLYSAYPQAYRVSGSSKEAFHIIHPSRNSMPMLRNTFAASSKTISKARLYVSSRGIYEIYINGRRVGDDYFNPGATQYTKTHLYQTYDVTDYMHDGKNAVGAILGEGWWSGGSTFVGDFWNFFGDRQSLLAKLVITYADGRSDTITTDPLKWKYYSKGPLVYGSFFQGEVYDAGKENLVKDWSAPTYNDSAWTACQEIALKGNISTDNGWGDAPRVDDFSKMALIGQFGETVKKIKEINAVSVEEVRPGVFVYDMGQNMAGVPCIKLNEMKPGKQIYLRFAEVKYPDMPAYKENRGMIMLENIRAAMAQEIYTCKGGEETISPRFTYHGYRFVEISGIEKPLPLMAVKGQVLSSIHELASKYESSNPLVNKLWENITWSSYANFMSIPTDCPQRNERLGWSGDISVFSRTASYLATVPQFLRRHLMAMRDVQRADGRFPDVAPFGVGFGETIWGSAGIAVAWESYQQYNDLDLLAEHYEAMKKYVEYLIRDIDPVTGVFKEKERKQWSSLGDWLSLEDARNEKALFWESYFIYDLEVLSKMAAALQIKDDAARFAKLCADRKAFFNQTYIDKTTGKTAFRGTTIDTQTSYVLPFAFNVLDEKNAAAAQHNFANTITRVNKTDQNIDCPPYSLMTGFVGTAWIGKALSDHLNSAYVYRLLQQTTYPSWLYPIEQGATTVWERLNSYTKTDGFGSNNSMNSFNHYSFGAVGAWLYNYSLGISRDEAAPGFSHFVLQPEPDTTGQMKYARGHYDSAYGRIESSWEVKGDVTNYHFVIPANTSATLSIPALSLKEVSENNLPISTSKDLKFLRMEKGRAVFEVQSGEYQFARRAK